MNHCVDDPVGRHLYSQGKRHSNGCLYGQCQWLLIRHVHVYIRFKVTTVYTHRMCFMCVMPLTSYKVVQGIRKRGCVGWWCWWVSEWEGKWSEAVKGYELKYKCYVHGNNSINLSCVTVWYQVLWASQVNVAVRRHVSVTKFSVLFVPWLWYECTCH